MTPAEAEAQIRDLAGRQARGEITQDEYLALSAPLAAILAGASEQVPARLLAVLDQALAFAEANPRVALSAAVGLAAGLRHYLSRDAPAE